MSFTIDIQKLADFEVVRIQNQHSLEHIDIVTKGGLLNSWVLRPLSGSFDIIDGNNFENGWSNFEANGFKGGKMNPFSCRLHNGQYMHESNTYTIEKFYLGAHALHGIVYDAYFEIKHTECNEEEASITLEYHYKGLDKGFPFNYTIAIQWTFTTENKVIAKTTITNHDHSSIPMMDGWHPYFKLGDSIDQCTIQFKQNGMLAYDEELIPMGNYIPCHDFEKPLLLQNVNQDNGYLLDPTQPACTLENDLYKLVITPDSNYPYLQLYTPPNRKSIAIENLSAAPDCFNNKMGLQIMQPQSVWSLETRYQLWYK